MKASFTFFNITIKSYTLFLYLAMFSGLLLTNIIAKQKNINKKIITIIYLSCSIAMLIGARILNVFLNWSYFSQNISEIYSLSFKGFSLYGGISLSVITLLTLSKVYKLNTHLLLDTFIPGGCISLFLVRIGCFLNGCCYGKETTSIFGVTFPSLGNKVIQTLFMQVSKVHPTQLYEAFAGLICLFISLYLINKARTGTTFITIALLFTIVRWINYYLRTYPSYMNTHTSFYPILYAGIILLLITYWFTKVRKNVNKEKNYPSFSFK